MCVLLEFLQKNMGDPYYEPTIVVHDNTNKTANFSFVPNTHTVSFSLDTY